MLAPNRPFYYILKAEVVRDGQTYSDIRHVKVTAGKESTVDFGDLRSLQTAHADHTSPDASDRIRDSIAGAPGLWEDS